MTTGTGMVHPESKAAPGASELQLGVIKDARRRQRRRWLAIVATIVAAAVVAVIVDSAGGGNGARPAASTPPQFGPGTIESPSAVFVQDPYMGVSCPIANSIACDRIGLAVWLRRPAVVTATIAGALLRLNAPHWSYVTHDNRGPLYVYAGFLQPAGLTNRLHVTAESNSWFGANAPSPLVWFRINYGHGNVLITHEHVFLSAGWG